MSVTSSGQGHPCLLHPLGSSFTRPPFPGELQAALEESPDHALVSMVLPPSTQKCSSLWEARVPWPPEKPGQGCSVYLYQSPLQRIFCSPYVSLTA